MSAARTVVKHRFVRVAARRAAGRRETGAGYRIRRALRYMERRPLGPSERADDRRLFDRASDGIARAAACAVLATEATGQILYHRLILSPGVDTATRDREETLRWTRQLLADLERRWNKRLGWVAAVHRHTDHTHIHVLLGAQATRDDGTREQVRFTPADYAFLRERGDYWTGQASANRALLDDVERYLAIAAVSTMGGMLRRGLGSEEVVHDDEEEEHRRRDTRHR